MAKLTGFMFITGKELEELDERAKMSDNIQGNFDNLLDRFKAGISEDIAKHAKHDIPYGKVFDEFDVRFEGELAGFETAWIEVKFEWYGDDGEVVLKFEGNFITRAYRDTVDNFMEITDFFSEKTVQMLSDFAHGVRESYGLK